MAQKLDWEERPEGRLSQLSGAHLWVSDGMAGHAALLPAGMMVGEALADYAVGYEAGDCPTISVQWQLWEDGVMLRQGRHEFEATHA